MVLKSEIDFVLTNAIKDVLKDYKNINNDTIFIGLGSEIESLEVVQIISSVEDRLESRGYEGFDLFEKTFEYESLTFEDFLDLVKNNLE